MKITFLAVAVLAYTSVNAQKRDSASLFIAKAEPKTHMKFKPTNDVEIYDGVNMIAYKKRDSSWVFINPDKTKVVLDSIILQQFKNLIRHK